MNSSPLLRLPPELRNQIYELLLSTKTHAIFGQNNALHPIAQTCPKLYEETRLLHYEGLSIRIRPRTGSQVSKWIKQIGKEAASVIYQYSSFVISRREIELVEETTGLEERAKFKPLPRAEEVKHLLEQECEKSVFDGLCEVGVHMNLATITMGRSCELQFIVYDPTAAEVDI
jgi:hypothetical protein